MENGRAQNLVLFCKRKTRLGHKISKPRFFININCDLLSISTTTAHQRSLYRLFMQILPAAVWRKLGSSLWRRRSLCTQLN